MKSRYACGVQATCAGSSRCQPCDRSDVRDLRHRIGRTLKEHQPRRRGCQDPFDAGEIFDGQHGVRDAKTSQQPPYQIARWVVGLDKAQNVIPLFREREQRLGDRRDPGGRDQAVGAPLQFGEQQLQLPCGRI
jgi:hypothetical protein